ncbi:MAG: (2Fe-2S) ferredoxin domain-containing protein [Terracidiphilus sp.]
MASADNPVEIVVCLGSSCFARGNAQNLSTIETYLQSHKLDGAVRVTGSLCQDECKQGPNLSVCGESQHEVAPAKLREILQSLSGGRR